MIGVDIVELKKIKQHCKKDYFLKKVFTTAELEYAAGKPEHLATTFAAKEAVFKAIGNSYFEPKDIEILRTKDKKPYVILSKKLKKSIKNKKIALSISFSDNYAVAFAMLK